MLGWYGLNDSSNCSNCSIIYDNTASPGLPENARSFFPAAPSRAESNMHQDLPPLQKENSLTVGQQVGSTPPADSAPVTSCNDGARDQGRGNERAAAGWDGTAMPSVTPPPVSFEGTVNQAANGNNGQDKKMGGRKLIGMRYLFPPPPDGLSLLEKARVWVARHDYKYFVGWSDEQLARVEPALRPVCPITADLYKTHMNRSEYCRNVKLKYCLESDSEWAQEFREKLAKPYNKGGFSGLCQAKIVAAELWRKHSENYKSHQARYPNPKSKYRARRMSLNLPDQTSAAPENPYFADPLTSLGLSRNDSLRGSQPTTSAPRLLQGGSFDHCNVRKDSAVENSNLTLMSRDETQSSTEVPSAQHLVMSNQEAITQHAATAIHIKEEPSSQNAVSESTFEPGMDEAIARQRALFEGLVPRPQMFSAAMTEEFSNTANYQSFPAINLDSLHLSQQKKTNTPRNNDYRKSERGLSYLFPSLIDQQLSLLDKVRITVLRHKNNYFLGWTEDQLKHVDPLVRPKMPVTRDLYKEYCHRNAMKYDSNLQFAMESQTAWAIEFRERLVKPPNEGGFHSLCEVKQEAGRLWKEFSGRYKMHNVVKAQMDMNNEHVKTPTAAAAGADRDEQHGTIFDDVHDYRSTTSSPGPRFDRITIPLRKFISRSANSSPTTLHEDNPFRYPAAQLTLQGSRKRKQSDDSGCASLPSPTERGATDTDITMYKHNFAHGNFSPLSPDETVRYALHPLRPSFAHQAPNTTHLDRHTHAKFPRLQGPTASHGFATEVTNSMLFAPMPPELSVANQLLIWLQRHRSSYYNGLSQQQLGKLNPFLRPLYVVTPEVLKNHISPSMFAMFDKVEEILGAETLWSKAYQNKLSLPPDKGGFETIEEALTRAVEIWTAHCQPKVSPPQDKDVQNPGLIKLKNMFRAKSFGQENVVPDSPAANHTDPHNTLEGLLQPKPTSTTTSDPDTGDMPRVIEVCPTEEDTALDLSNKIVTTDSQPTTQKGSDMTEKKLSHHDVVSRLWTCRQELQELCGDSVASSWQDRLQPHLTLLHEKLGDGYQMPSSVSGCMVDLMLVILHEQFAKA